MNPSVLLLLLVAQAAAQTTTTFEVTTTATEAPLPEDPSINVIDGEIFINARKEVSFVVGGVQQTLSDLINSAELKKDMDDTKADYTAKIQAADSKFTQITNNLKSQMDAATVAITSGIVSSTTAQSAALEALRVMLDSRINDLALGEDYLNDVTTNLTRISRNQDSAIATLQARASTQESIMTEKSALISGNIASLSSQAASISTQGVSISSQTVALSTQSSMISTQASRLSTQASQISTQASMLSDQAKQIADLSARVDTLLPRAPSVTMKHIYSSIITIVWDTAVSPLVIASYEIVVSNATSLSVQRLSAAADAREITITGLLPLTAYNVSVAAVTPFGTGARGLLPFTTLVDDITATSFSCKPSAWQVAAGASVTTVCTVDVPLRGKSIIHAAAAGHASCPSPALYMSIFVDSDDTRIDDQAVSPCHSYLSNWHTVRTSRIRYLDKTGTIQVRLVITSGSNCQVSGVSLQGVVLNVHSPNVARYGCVPSAGWSVGFGATSASPGTLCEATFNTGGTSSLAVGFFGGHIIAAGSSWVYGVVNFDNEMAVKYANSVSNQNLIPAHTYATNWAPFNSGRAVMLAAGAHKVQTNIGAGVGATFNGAGFQGFSIESKRANIVFSCVPSGWSVQSVNTVVTVCQTSVVATVPSVIWAEFTGHAQATGGGSCYGLISLNNDGAAALAAYGGDLVQTKGAALTTLTVNWENFGGSRSMEVAAGSHNVGIMIRCNVNGYLNGAGMSGYIVNRV